MSEFTIYNIMGWEEDDTKKLKRLIDKFENSGFNISIWDVKEDIDIYGEITDLDEWFSAIARITIDQMIQTIMDYVESDDDLDENGNLFDKLLQWQENIEDCFEVEDCKIIHKTPFKMFKIDNFYDTYEDKIEKLINQIKKCE